MLKIQTTLMFALIFFIGQSFSFSTEELLLFGDKHCEDCKAVKTWWAKNPQNHQGINLKYLDIENMDNFKYLLCLEKELGKKSGSSFPVIAFRNEFIFGDNILKVLKGKLADKSSTVNKSESIPSGEDALSSCSQQNATNSQSIISNDKVILAYFLQTGCQHCARADIALAHVKKLIPNLEIDRFDVFTPRGRTMLEVARRHFGLVGSDKSLVPLIVWKDGYINGDSIIPEQFARTIADKEKEPANVSMVTSKDEESKIFWRNLSETELAKISAEITTSFEKVSFAAILTAGLIDGVNPCAMATVIFLMSYLALAGRTRREVWITGGSFCLGVFIAYFIIGLGLLQFINYVQQFSWIMKAIYVVMAVAAFGLFIFTIRDIILLRKKGAGAMELGLPEKLKNMIHKIIRKNVRKDKKSFFNTGGILIASIFMGFVVSILELACTGQIYLPTLILINSLNASGRSMLALGAYNLAFILPLLLITILTGMGITSVHLAAFASKNTGVAKSFMAILFLGITVLMSIFILYN